MPAQPLHARLPAAHGVNAVLAQTSPTPIYVARPLRADETSWLNEAFRLRADVFAGELGWVPPVPHGIERDRCDDVVLHVAAFVLGRGQRPRLAGYARLLLPEQTFMLECEFAALLAGRPFHPSAARAFEVSRFVVHPAYRGRLDADRHSVADHLARAIARWAIAHHRTELYAVCEERHIRALRMRALPFARLGVPVEYQPGVRARAARLSLPEAASHLRLRRMRDYAWYRQGANTPW